MTETDYYADLVYRIERNLDLNSSIPAYYKLPIYNHLIAGDQSLSLIVSAIKVLGAARTLELIQAKHAEIALEDPQKGKPWRRVLTYQVITGALKGYVNG